MGAIGICKIKLDKDDTRNNDICAFSQFSLSECDSIAALIYSKDQNNGHLGNKWHYLCNEDETKIHLFDSDYLSQWIQLKGCEFIACPLCKTGTEEKEMIEEHNIDSMEQLKERRDASKKENDLYMTLHVEQLILDKACTEKWDRDQNRNRLLMNQQILRDVLNHWISKKKIDEFRDKIVESTQRCIQAKNAVILKIILKYCNYEKIGNNNESRKREVIEFINIAARNASFDCLKLLLIDPKKIEWTEQKRPLCLLNAIKYHHANLEMISFMMDALEKVKISFVCDDVFAEVIKHDLVDVAKRIINNRWHKITEKDELLAEHINLACSTWLKSRRSAFEFNACDDGDGITLDDEEWGDDDDDGFDEDDDWANTPNE